MLKYSIGVTTFLLSVLFLAGCGQKQEFPLASGNNMSTAPAEPGKPMPSEASLNFSLQADQPNVQLSYTGQHLTDCQLAKDPSQNRIFFTVGFQDVASSSSIHLKLMTAHPDIGAQPITETQSIYGDGENSGTLAVILGAAGRPFTNRVFLPNRGKPAQSFCNVNYTLADSMIKGKLFCYDLMNEAGESITGALNFACAVAQVPRAQTKSPNAPKLPMGGAPTVVPAGPTNPTVTDGVQPPVLLPEGKI